MTIVVYGNPVGQGNHRATKDGIIYETTKNHKPWRDSVGWAAREAGERLAGPVCVEMVFTLPKPKSAPKRRVTYPDRKPDIDKLVRSVLDSLKVAGTIEDDARVISLKAMKVYVGEGCDALDVPGAIIRIGAHK
jgi:Holliday junction resolvase RusA-like endonuclease